MKTTKLDAFFVGFVLGVLACMVALVLTGVIA